MDKPKIQILRAAFTTALLPLQDDLGVVFEVGKALYTDNSCTFKIEVMDNLSPDGKGMDFMALAFKAD